MTDEPYKLQKGDELWLVSNFKMYKASVHRVWPYQCSVVAEGLLKIHKFQRTPNSNGNYCLAQGTYGYSNQFVAFLPRDKNVAEIELRKRTLENERYRLSQWINRDAPLDVVETVLKLKERYEVKGSD